MLKKTIDLVKEKILYQKKILENVKKLNKITPIVKQNLERDEFSKKIIDSIPPNRKEIFDSPKIIKANELDLKNIKQHLNNFHNLQVDYQKISGTVNAGNATAASGIYNAFTVGGAGISNNNSNFVNQLNDEYSHLQQKQNRPVEISKLIKVLNLNEEFLNANDLYYNAQSEIIAPKEAANSMRNVLNHFIGNLINLSREHEGENVKKSEKWKFICNRLAIGGEESIEHSLLLTKDGDLVLILTELTKITKNMIDKPLSKLQIIHSKWLDFLYSIKLMELN